jgi:methyl-accepting chemotaxis protein
VAEEIDRNVTNIAGVAEQTTRSAQETVHATEAISGTMRELNHLIARFKM